MRTETITRAQAAEALRMFSDGMSLGDVADSFGVDDHVIEAAIRRALNRRPRKARKRG